MNLMDHDLDALMATHRDHFEKGLRHEVPGPNPLAFALMQISNLLEIEGYGRNLSTVFPGQVVIDACWLMGGAPMRFKEVSVVKDDPHNDEAKHIVEIATFMLIELGFTPDASVASLCHCRGFPFQAKDLSNHQRIAIFNRLYPMYRRAKARLADAGAAHCRVPAEG